MNWWTLDFAKAFVSPGVNSRAELVPSPRGITPGTALHAVGSGMNLINTVLGVEEIGFMAGKSSAEPSLKLHLLRLEMHAPLYQDVKICNLAL